MLDKDVMLSEIKQDYIETLESLKQTQKDLESTLLELEPKDQVTFELLTEISNEKKELDVEIEEERKKLLEFT